MHPTPDMLRSSGSRPGGVSAYCPTCEVGWEQRPFTREPCWMCGSLDGVLGAVVVLCLHAPNGRMLYGSRG